MSHVKIALYIIIAFNVSICDLVTKANERGLSYS